jgi:hypothetical protein
MLFLKKIANKNWLLDQKQFKNFTFLQKHFLNILAVSEIFTLFLHFLYNNNYRTSEPFFDLTEMMKNSYLCTYDSYSPVHNVLHARISITRASGRGGGWALEIKRLLSKYSQRFLTVLLHPINTLYKMVESNWLMANVPLPPPAQRISLSLCQCRPLESLMHSRQEAPSVPSTIFHLQCLQIFGPAVPFTIFYPEASPAIILFFV